jgi:hypothetical protein
VKPMDTVNGPLNETESRDAADTLRMKAAVGDNGPEGVVRLWDEEGRPQIVADYVNGQPHGVMRIFDLGRPQLELQFVEGRQHGPAVAFHPDGSVSSRSEWVHGVQQGPASHFAPGGVRVRDEHFVGGRLHGLAVDYYPDGRVQQRSNWAEGVLEGEQITFDGAGGTVSRIWFKQGKPQEIPVRPGGAGPRATTGAAGAKAPPPQTVLDRVLARWRG